MEGSGPGDVLVVRVKLHLEFGDLYLVVSIQMEKLLVAALGNCVVCWTQHNN